ncbi:MAG: hypothetical protein LBF38_05490, partial [Deltaproteobacteria bacterium]|nr:hypothetical protein [Deltaproteobacteria bacterium]
MSVIMGQGRGHFRPSAWVIGLGQRLWPCLLALGLMAALVVFALEVTKGTGQAALALGETVLVGPGGKIAKKAGAMGGIILAASPDLAFGPKTAGVFSGLGKAKKSPGARGLALSGLIWIVKNGNLFGNMVGGYILKVQNPVTLEKRNKNKDGDSKKSKEFIDKYFSVDQIFSYFALIFSILFIFYFWRDFKFGLGLCSVISLICLGLLYYFTCKNFQCDVYKWLHLYLIGPALYCLNGPVNRAKYVLLPPAALLLAVIFTYNFEIPLIICFVFIAIN